MHRGVPFLAAILLLASGLGAAAWWLTSGTAGNPNASTDTKPDVPVVARHEGLRILAANVRMDAAEDNKNAWPERRDLLVRTLLKYNPDIIGTQEVTPAQGAFLFRELKGFSHYPRGKAENNGNISGLAASIEGTFSGLNTLFLRDERLEILDSANGLVLPDALQDKPSENTFYSLVVVRDRAKKVKDLIVLNTHLRHDTAFAQRCALRLRQILADWQKKYPDAGLVVLGDMNHDRSGPVYATLTRGQVTQPLTSENLTLLDTFDYSQQKKGEAWGNWHAFTGKPKRGLPTDLIFISPALKASPAQFIRDAGPNGLWPSDHFFVWTDLQNP